MKNTKFVQINNREVLNVALSDNAFRIYAYLKTHKLDDFTPSYRKMEEDMGKSRMTLYRGLKELQDHDLIMTTLDPHKGFIRISFIYKLTSILKGK